MERESASARVLYPVVDHETSHVYLSSYSTACNTIHSRVEQSGKFPHQLYIFFLSIAMVESRVGNKYPGCDELLDISTARSRTGCAIVPWRALNLRQYTLRGLRT